ncbi:TetR/AcrR family transcriptional regulator, partial [Streptomyces sp. SID8455]|nr:TetR/AcrR family transcriptional regulator [Streptomyces sp. SID8455]
LGAAEAVAAELNRGRASVDDAVTALTGLIVGGLGTRTDC